MPTRRKRTEEEIKAQNEAYLKKTKRWGNISNYVWNTIREAAYLLDVTPAEVRRRIRTGELIGRRVRMYHAGTLIRNRDLEIVRYPPFEPKRIRPFNDD